MFQVWHRLSKCLFRSEFRLSSEIASSSQVTVLVKLLLSRKFYSQSRCKRGILDWGGKQKVSDEKTSYSEYFSHNNTIVGVLSLFCGFLFTSITILLTALQNKGGMLAQITVLFLTFIFYFSLYVLLDNLEMAFHYIRDIPPLTLKVKPFFYLLLIFYFFGTSTILMFLLFDLPNLAVISALVWIIVVIASITSTVRRFYKQSIARYWPKKKA